MASPARPYRFPAPPEDERRQRATTRCTSRSCGTCSGSALASCVALCLCPCAVVSCLTLALVKAPYVAGRRCLVRVVGRSRLRLRKARRVRDVGEDEREVVIKASPRRSREWGELAREVGTEGMAMARVASSGLDPAEKVWVEMYQVGLWGFGRLSLSPPPTMAGGASDSEKDGDNAVQ